jgi:hypothetical protein
MCACSPRSRSRFKTNSVMFRPAIGTCLMEEPMTYPSATGIVSTQARQPTSTSTARVGLTGNTVSTVDDNTCQVSLVNFTARPRRSERQHGLNGNVTGRRDMSAKCNGDPDETYRPWMLKLSNMISAVFSRFSGGFKGGSVCDRGSASC